MELGNGLIAQKYVDNFFSLLMFKNRKLEVQEIFMKELGRAVDVMDLASAIIWMAVFMRENGRTI